MVLLINVVSHVRDSSNNEVDMDKPRDCTDRITKNRDRVNAVVE